jgi:hypothetical protein
MPFAMNLKMISFVLPKNIAIRYVLLRYLPLLLIGIYGLLFLRKYLSIIGYILIAGLFVYVGFVCWLKYQKMWFSISQRGIHGTHFFKDVLISWNTDVMLSGVAGLFQGKPKGNTLFSMAQDGIPKFGSIYMPQVLTDSVEFKNAMMQYAPKAHPLYQLIK